MVVDDKHYFLSDQELADGKDHIFSPLLCSTLVTVMGMYAC